MPVHGEYRHLLQHARLAESVGIPAERIFLVEDGLGLEITKSGARVLGGYPGRAACSSTARAWATWAPWCSATVSSSPRRAWWWWRSPSIATTGSIVAGPEIASRGFVYMKEADELMEEVKTAVRDALAARAGAGGDRHAS